MRKTRKTAVAICTALLLAALPEGASRVQASPAEKSALDAYHRQLRALGLPPGLGEPAMRPDPIREVTLAPLFDEPFACTEHPLGQLTGTGDALGTDCMIVGGATDEPHG